MNWGGRIFLHGIIMAALLGLIYFFTLGLETLKAFLLSPGLHAIIVAIILNVVAIIFNFRAVKSMGRGRRIPFHKGIL